MVIFEVGLRGFLIVKAPFILKYLLLFFPANPLLIQTYQISKVPTTPLVSCLLFLVSCFSASRLSTLASKN